jgi:C4-dicarboxylate-specific signal transduction histidine kinase
MSEDCYRPRSKARPRIVCLCGSTRFYREFQEANFRETMAGRIVLTVGFYPHAAVEAHGQDIGITPNLKAELDELDKRKVDMADEILVIDVNGYIGLSTHSEIFYARSLGKPVRSWSSEYRESLKPMQSADKE